ncbi:hypothetical protein J7T55_006692 [Diaporthe amygdali]|uniref:uncharacterized protein n=1 Tax=Phomopsis amygdali TaxID=1214568 RepID=UPI0022FDF39E|nr:uncharacterized protein J7T55_006692 [Diaporthe amygdali]KAJ0125346.1 hypothetical protein J7T55_006692 [Diaporthe amygdali]
MEDVDARRTEGNAPKSRRLLPGESEAMKFLKKRDHILMIDNSKHMREFKVQVLNVFANLAHILEAADPNGLDVICTSDPGNMQHNRATERLVQFVQNNYDKGASSPCYIEPALKILVDKIISKLPSGPGEKKGLRSWIKNESARPISIYVLTSGVWDSSPGARDGPCGADRPINQLITELKRRNLHKNQVAFQFIRFGDYATGIERLKFLDNSLGKPDHNGGVWPMLVGSLDEGNDREDDT